MTSTRTLHRTSDASRRPLRRRTVTTAVLGAAAGSAMLLASPGAALAGESSTGGLPDAEKSLLLVGIEWTGYVEYPTTDGGWAWSDAVEVLGACTGWFASEEGHIMTAGHCVNPDEIKAKILSQFLADNDASHLQQQAAGWRVGGWEDGETPDREAVWVMQPSAVEGAVIEDPLTVQVLDFQPFEDGDLALLKANGLSEATPPLPVATESESVGDPVTVMGYPGNVRQVSDFARLRASFKTGTVSSTQVTEKGVAQMEIDAEMSGGMSGGPTVNGDGAVLGINSYGFDGDTTNFITDTAALRSYLEQHGVEPVAPAEVREGLPTDVNEADAGAPRPASEDDGIGLPVILGGVGALVLAAGGAFLLARRRPAAAAAGVAPAPVQAPAPAPAPAPAFDRQPVMTPSAAPAPNRDAIQLVARPVPGSFLPPVEQEGCAHRNNAPGARFCGDCGQRLTA